MRTTRLDSSLGMYDASIAIVPDSIVYDASTFFRQEFTSNTSNPPFSFSTYNNFNLDNAWRAIDGLWSHTTTLSYSYRWWQINWGIPYHIHNISYVIRAYGTYHRNIEFYVEDQDGNNIQNWVYQDVQASFQDLNVNLTDPDWPNVSALRLGVWNAADGIYLRDVQISISY